MLSCWRPWPCSTSWARFFHMVSKAGISRFLSISSSNSWAIYASSPTSHLTLVPDFNACFTKSSRSQADQVSYSLEKSVVSLNSVAKMLPLGTQEDKGHDPSLRCQRALAFGQKWDPTRAAAGCSCHAAYPRSRWLQSPLNVKKGFKEAN